MRAVALTLALSLSVFACFPNNARHRQIAKIAEGVAVAGGIGMLFFVNTGADCDAQDPSMRSESCKGSAQVLSNLGLGLILAGMVGFIATVSTSPDDTTTTSIPPPPPPPPGPSEPAPGEPLPAPAPSEP